MTHKVDISPISRLMMRIDAAADGVRPPEGMPTGFPSLDERLGGGLRRGDLVALAGDAGVGKSALALAVALRARAAGHPAMFLSGEMAPERVLERALAIEGRASIDDLRRGTIAEDTRAALGAAALRMRDQLPVLDRLPATAAELDVLLDGVHGTELLVVDSLQCLAAGAAAHHDELAAAVVALKTVAMDRNVAVLVTTHLSGRGGSAPDSRPSLADLGAHGQVKQLSDVVLGLYREALYDAARANEGATELLILKNRGGGVSYVDLYFYESWLRFEDMV